MNVTIKVPCDIKLNGSWRHFQPGEVLNLSDDRAAKLINAGYADAEQPNIAEIRHAVAEFGMRDPRADCWAWLKKNKPELWKKHLKVLLDADVTAARLTFNEMIVAYNCRQQ